MQVEVPIGTVVVDGIALRRTSRGQLALSYPHRRASNGRTFNLIRPVDDRARRELEARVLAALEEMGVKP